MDNCDKHRSSNYQIFFNCLPFKLNNTTITYYNAENVFLLRETSIKTKYMLICFKICILKQCTMIIMLKRQNNKSHLQAWISLLTLSSFFWHPQCSNVRDIPARRPSWQPVFTEGWWGLPGERKQRRISWIPLRCWHSHEVTTQPCVGAVAALKSFVNFFFPYYHQGSCYGVAAAA